MSLCPNPETWRLVTDAIAHARAKHGARCIDHLPLHHRVSVLVEEVGEVARAAQDYDAADNMSNINHARRCLRAELAQVAACCLMWLEEELINV
jgi:NTP pyrophosphatase (non-canonical NTP hydrolase)